MSTGNLGIGETLGMRVNRRLVRCGMVGFVLLWLEVAHVPPRASWSHPRGDLEGGHIIEELFRADAVAGEFDIAIFNVGGLPALVSPLDPGRANPLIASRLDEFDIVLLQEDFAHHEAIVSALRGPMQWTDPSPPTLLRLGDGLARFSKRRLGSVRHQPWQEAHGIVGHLNDELAAKGFAVGEIEIAPGRTILVYNLHADAGRSAGDSRARRAQFEQLARDIETHARAGQALIVAGDFNADPGDEEDASLFAALGARTGLRDALEDSGSNVGSIDRVLYRSASDLALIPTGTRTTSRLDHDDETPLSDHRALSVTFRWQQTQGGGTP